MMDYSMNTAPLTVTQPVQLELIDSSGTATPIEAELRYDATDPFAVTTVFMTGHSEVRWTFGRELLAEGLYEPAGDGDVHVWPAPGQPGPRGGDDRPARPTARRSCRPAPATCAASSTG